jgi:lipopolysaccharide heptosyltransferase II
MIERRKHQDIPRVESGIGGSGEGCRFKKILVVRPDRLGDVILSTPVFEVLKKHFPRTQITALVKTPVVPVLKGLPEIDQLMIFDPEKNHLGMKGFLRLCRELRDANYDVALVLQSHWKIAAALFFARIRFRIGPLSKPHSFLFYNRGVRQKRSHVEMHETDYNLQLLRVLGIRVGSRNIATRVHISPEVKEAARKWLLEKNWNPDRPLILVHPGMGGSALNWPESHYQDLIRSLVQEGHPVLVTGGPAEGELLDRIEKGLGSASQSVIFYRAQPENQVDFLGALCSFAAVAVAPSTGPLHLAVAVNTPVVTFYPPIRVQSALRWGPYLPDETRASILVPEIYCGQDFKCLGNMCNYFPCMKGLTVEQTLTQVRQQLQSKSKESPVHVLP